MISITYTGLLEVAGQTFIFIAYSGDCGFLVVIDDCERPVSCYAHCSIIYMTVGQEVSAGDMMARIGSTRQSTGSHFHLEIIKNGRHLSQVY